MELITDRSQAHVDRLNALRSKGWNNLTDSEKAEWYGEASKGAYNYTDLNRVESAVADISAALGLTLATKTNWSMWDDLTQADMTRYLNNIEAVRNACPSGVPLPEVPSRMSGLTYEAANRLEEILLLAKVIADSIPRSGEIYSGEV